MHLELPAWANDLYGGSASFRINDGAPSIGHAAIEETARSFMTAFPDMVVHLVELRQTEDHIEFHWHWTGTNCGCGSVIHGIGFDYDSAVIRPDSAPVLDALFGGLKDAPESSITIVGHTSSEGAEDYNRELSHRRAAAAGATLAERGIDARAQTTCQSDCFEEERRMLAEILDGFEEVSGEVRTSGVRVD